MWLSSAFAVVGGVKFADYGTFTEYVVVDRNQVLLALEFIDDVYPATWPLGGLPAWRSAIFSTCAALHLVKFH